ncbi:hypothetical protein HAV15_001256 [Penicillium sp. str. |nr:hypothetical protein HAV15_001256 [Penicillium sp. str. \
MIVDITIGRRKLLDCSNLHAGTTPFDASLKPYASICTASNLPFPLPVFRSNHKPASGSQVGFMNFLPPPGEVRLSDTLVFLIIASNNPPIHERKAKWPSDFNFEGDIHPERWPVGHSVVLWAFGQPFIPVYGDYYLLCGSHLRPYLWQWSKKRRGKALPYRGFHSGRNNQLGFMREYQRFSVACSRGRFGLCILYNQKGMKDLLYKMSAFFVKTMLKYIADNQLSCMAQATGYEPELLTTDEQSDDPVSSRPFSVACYAETYDGKNCLHCNGLHKPCEIVPEGIEGHRFELLACLSWLDEFWSNKDGGYALRPVFGTSSRLFDNFAHRRAHSLPGTNLPQVFAKMKADTAANTPNPVDPTLDTSNLAPDPDTPTPTIVELTENDDWIDDQDSASLKSWQ